MLTRIHQTTTIQEPQMADGYLYVAQEGHSGAVKIGVAHHPSRRLADLQQGNHRQMYLRAAWSGYRAACAQVERDVAQALRDAVIRGRWYRVKVDDVVAAVEAATTERRAA